MRYEVVVEEAVEWGVFGRWRSDGFGWSFGEEGRHGCVIIYGWNYETLLRHWTWWMSIAAYKMSLLKIELSMMWRRGFAPQEDLSRTKNPIEAT